jgi:5-methylcytosine-specific restriction endonuclease McrA
VRKCEGCGETLAANKRPHARFCTRKCKERTWSRLNQPTSEQNAARYIKERDRRLAYSKEYQKANPQVPQRAKRKRKALLTGNGVYRISAKDWRRELQRHDNKCFYCKAEGVLTMDHVIPASRGGTHSIGNLVPACKSCNSSKRDRTIMEWRMKLPSPRQRRTDVTTGRTTATC